MSLLAILAAAFLLFGLVSRRAEDGVVSAPMAFTVLGVVLAVGEWAPVADGGEHPAWLHVLAEVGLALILFTDASRIDARRLWREHSLPARMLGVGLPLCVVFGGAAAAGILPGLSIWEALLLSAILAPTDAALGQAVVSSPAVPERIRQTLNVESGLNDGIALPAVLILMCSAAIAAGGHDEERTTAQWLSFVAMQVTLGPVVGAFVGGLGGAAVERAARAGGWMSPPFERLAALSIAWLAFAGAELAGGNGFLAAFVAGLTLGCSTNRVREVLQEFGEAEGQLLALLTFAAFGACMVPAAWGHIDLAAVAYAVLSLTAVRMLSVAVSLRGAGLDATTIAFLGWFGPRGIASILFLLVVVESVELPGGARIEAVVVLTVLLSVIAHGVTASPLARAYGRRSST